MPETERPAFAKVEWAWERTLAILADKGEVDLAGEPTNYATANAVYHRILRKYAPAEFESDRVERLAEQVREASVATIVPHAHVNEHKRAEILELDIGGWYLTRAGLVAHDQWATQRLYFATTFVRVMGPAAASPAATVQPLFVWTVERLASTFMTAEVVAFGPGEPEGGRPISKSTHQIDDSTSNIKITHEIARYLVRDCPEAPAYMAEQMQRSLTLLDEAIIDVEHEMPTIGGVECPPSVLDHRATKEFMRNEMSAIESAIRALPTSRR